MSGIPIQISQFDQPLAGHGWVEVEMDGTRKRTGITRVHIEEDAGRNRYWRRGAGSSRRRACTIPKPDLAPLRISDELLGRLLAEMPELPTSKRARRWAEPAPGQSERTGT